MNTKTLLLGDVEISRSDLNAISEIVADALQELGIDAASFAWHIEVEYTEQTTEKGEQHENI